MKKTLFLFIIFAVIFCTVGCTSSNKKTDNKSSLTVWSAPSTVRVGKDKNSYTDKQAAVLNYKVAKGEYENAQLIVTPEKNISNYELEVSDIIGSKGKIEKANIYVYTQKYINVTAKVNKNEKFPAGYYPDALIPFQYAKEKGENIAKSGENQGLLVTVYVPENTPAGIYTSQFNLKMDGTNLKIPVEVLVWDFVVPKETHAKNTFVLSREYLSGGEFDSTTEMYKNYYDFLLDYRISSTQLPVFTNDTSEFVNKVKEYYNNPNVTTYNLPYNVINIFDSSLNRDVRNLDCVSFKAVLKELVKNSDNKNNLLSKAICYFSDIVDEPQLSGLTVEAKKLNIDINRTKNEVIAELEQENPGIFKNMQNVKESLINIPDIITTDIYDEIDGNVDTWCPTIDKLNTEAQRSSYELRKINGNNVWFYTCGVPQYPYPSYQIDDYLLGGRILSWMQKSYNLGGNLYWCSNLFVGFNADTNKFIPTDVFQTSARFGLYTANGDGFLLYPGKTYNSSKPFPTIRLEAIRDGQEDYEYLWYLEKLYSDASGFYNTSTIDSKKVLNSIYETLFSGTVPTTNSSVLENAREEVASLIEEANSDAKVIIDNISIANGVAKVSFFANKEYIVKNANTVLQGTNSGNGVKYAYDIHLVNSDNYIDLTFTKNGQVKSFKKFISKKVSTICSFDNENEISNIKLSDQSTIDINKDKQYLKNGSSVKILIKSIFTGISSKDLAFKPYVSIPGSMFDKTIKFSNIDTLEMDVYNVYENDTNLSVVFEAGDFEKNISEFNLNKGWNHIKLSQIYNNNWKQLDNITAIRFEFDNLIVNSKAIDRTMYFDNLFCTYKTN